MSKKIKQITEETPSVSVAKVGGPISDNIPPGPSRLIKRILRRRKIQESQQAVIDHINQFKSYAAMELGLMDVPEVNVIDSKEEALNNTSFGGYMPSTKTINLNVAGRHVADVLRTLAHELVHHKQNEDGRLTVNAGETGSEFENEANSRAGILMRVYGRKNPAIYENYEKS
jgi:hypothetical protein